ncbi:aspartate carbamoyltransferase catalytic subunit [Vallitaleaceae bacterium 9-2]
MSFNKKHFLDLKTLTEAEINYVINSAQKMKYILLSKSASQPLYLKGKTVATLFDEESSRSKLSYELAALNLGAKVIHLHTDKHFKKGESLKDIGRYIDQIGADFIVIRHEVSGSPHHLSKYVKASIINAGDGMNENPSQSLIDLMTIQDQKKNFKDLKVVIIGDVMHNRVAKSNIWALKKLGSQVAVVAPPTLLPYGIESTGVEIHTSVADAIIDADVIMTLRMSDKNEYNRLIPSINEYKKLYKLDVQRLSYAKEDAIVMHPGPINRGIEISSEVIDGESSLISKQQVNGVAIRMALFHLLNKKGGGHNIVG